MQAEAFALVPDLGDGSVIDANTGTITNGVAWYALYRRIYNVRTMSRDDEPEALRFFHRRMRTFSYTPSCTGATATITGDIGGVFAFANPQPTDGAVIDPATGEITNGVSGTTYTVEYTTSGNCPDTDTVSVTVFPLDDSSFTMSPTCDGGTATVTGLPGGTFAFNPVPVDGAVIDAVTGYSNQRHF